MAGSTAMSRIDIGLMEPVAQGIPTRAAEITAPGARLWKISLATLAAANAADTASSWKKRELNSTLVQSSGAFGWHSAVLKMGILGAVMGVEYLAMRHHAHPGLYRTLSIVNFCSAAAVGGVAAHNYMVPGGPR